MSLDLVLICLLLPVIPPFLNTSPDKSHVVLWRLYGRLITVEV